MAEGPRVLIVGGGMGGIAAAKELAHVPVEVMLVDCRNYYLFQPLIYEVAGAIVNIEDVSHAIRGLLRGQPNARVRLATATTVEIDRHQLVLEDGERIGYDYLILAAGLRSDVTRVAGALEHAFPMKTLDDAPRVRNHLLRRLETVAAHPELVAAGALDVVVIGGSRTDVEVVAAFSEIYNHALDKGMTSMVGYNAAVLQSGRIRIRGAPAFLLWGALHAYYVPGLRKRLSLRLTWLWSWATRRRAALLLIGEAPSTQTARTDHDVTARENPHPVPSTSPTTRVHVDVDVAT